MALSTCLLLELLFLCMGQRTGVLKYLNIIITICLGQDAFISHMSPWLKKFKSNYQKFRNVLLIGVLVLMASILNKAFTSLLLTAYFNYNVGPIAENIYDIYENKEVYVYGNKRRFEFVANSSSIPYYITKNIINRITQYENKSDFKQNGFSLANKDIVADVIKNKLILLIPTYHRELLLKIYKPARSLFSIANMKYMQHMVGHIVSKKFVQPFKRIIYM